MLNFYTEIFYDLLMAFAEKIHSWGNYFKDFAHQFSGDGCMEKYHFSHEFPKGLLRYLEAS